MAVDEPRALEPVADEREARRPDAVAAPEQDGGEEDVVVRVEGALFEEDAGVGGGRGEEGEVGVGEGEVVVAARFGEGGFGAGWGAGGGFRWVGVGVGVGMMGWETCPENTRTALSSAARAWIPALMCSMKVGVSPFL